MTHHDNNFQNQKFLKFCSHFGIQIPKSMLNAQIINSVHVKEKDCIQLHIKFNEFINFHDIKNFKLALNEKRHLGNIEVFYEFDLLQYTKEGLLNFCHNLTKTKFKYASLQNLNFDQNLIMNSNYDFTLKIYNKNTYEQEKDIFYDFVAKLKGYGFQKLNFNLKLVEIKHETPIEIEVEKENLNFAIAQALKENQSIKKDEDSLFTRKKSFSRLNTSYANTTIENLYFLEDKTAVEISGLVFKKEYKALNNANEKKHLYIISLTDLTSGIQLQYFTKELLSSEEEKILENDSWIKVKGRLALKIQESRETRIIYVDSFEKTVSPISESQDLMDEKDKRVELHISSKMNTMDGLLNPSEIIKQAEKFKMPAVAIMDLNGCQGYPEFYNTAKKSSVKPLYGTAFTIINKNVNLIIGDFENVNLRNTEYVAFDIETTSLFPRFGEVIEYGAVKVTQSLRIDNKEQFFIKAKQPLSSFTTNLTGITNKMLEDGKNIQDALDEIYSSLNNKIAIAHNARFDYHFLKEQFFKYNKPFPKFAVIDTLKVSRFLFPDDSKHKLQDLAKKVDIIYDENQAHRGDYDAEVLANVWIQLIGILEKNNIFDLKTLANQTSKSLYKREFAYEITTLAKNNQGLKEQFELISFASTDQYWNQPKLFWENLENKKNILIGSSTLRSKLLDDYFYGSTSLFIDTLEKLDYVEIPAPQVFSHWLEYGDLSKEELEFALKDIITKAKEKNKIVVATGDVKYNSILDKKAYEIVVYSKGIGNSRHYLYNYEKAKNNNIKIPTQNFLTTKEMLEQFAFLNDDKLIREIVIDNTQKIANLCEDIKVIKEDLYTPNFDNSDLKLKELVYKTAHEKYGEILPELIEKRIESELTPIIKHGFSVIYWISHVLIQKSIERGYVVGSRGSVGSSITAYLSGVSEVNPLPAHYICLKCKKFELCQDKNITSGFDLDPKKCDNCGSLMDTDGQTIPFETFLGFDADKVPDIDLNFSGEVQPEIHNEVKNIFGEYHTFRAGTVQTVADKTAYGYVKNYAEETKQEINEIYVHYLAKRIEGVKRTTGQHPGGILIIPKEFDVTDFTATNFPANDVTSTWKTTHFDFKAIHDNLLKLDILGHDNPTIIKLLEEYTGIKTSAIPKKDPKVMSLFSSTASMGIKPEDIDNEVTGALGLPEFGTKFVRKMLSSSKPSSFADLISLSGLSHGTDVWVGNAEDLILKRNFKLSDVISCRDDILVKLMNVDVPRKDAFKIMEKVRKGKGLNSEEEEFLLKYKVPQWQIDSMKKIKYMFPKAHAAAYVLMAWWSAYYKLYYPLEFYSVYLTARTDVLDIENMIDVKGGKRVARKLKELKIEEARRTISSTDEKLLPIFEIVQELYARGFYISNVSLTRSKANEWVIDKENNCLIPPFTAVKQLGLAVANSIVSARDSKEFISIEDFKQRTTTNNTLLERLKSMNVFDGLDTKNQMTLF
ncbi:PolC-type DNA polymerase III [Mycoplasmopsis columbina]|uniref:PolC-type DNA polymerase III n=1 Tax=Mycoplasmopsis columbina TaxID=114881 RepID=UPI0004A6EAB3|nr:PolC-type DNA polymerase III [Mycoplasmopsis columbina]VEU77169.1 DNA polymerase III polC-type [Mycoplasmopsis columbina]